MAVRKVGELFGVHQQKSDIRAVIAERVVAAPGHEGFERAMDTWDDGVGRWAGTSIENCADFFTVKVLCRKLIGF